VARRRRRIYSYSGETLSVVSLFSCASRALSRLSVRDCRPKKKMFACGVVEKEGCRQKRLEKEVDVRAGGFTL